MRSVAYRADRKIVIVPAHAADTLNHDNREGIFISDRAGIVSAELAHGLTPPASPINGGQQVDRIRSGVALGLLGVIAFSLTLPATRAAVPALGAIVVGLGRGVIAGCIALTYILVRRVELPRRQDWRGLTVVTLCVAFAFPLFTANAMRSLPAAHGAVITGLIPAATALMGVWRAGERPPWAFWLACGGGVVAVLIFAAVEGAGRPQAADLLLLAAVLAAGLGYAEGARLARQWGPGGGIRVISWATAIGAPFALAIVAYDLWRSPLPALASISTAAWLGLGYISVVSAYVGMFPWYAGLARGGVARVGQVQLIQLVLSLGWAALLLGEPIHARTFGAAILVVASAGSTLVLRNGQHGHSMVASPKV